MAYSPATHQLLVANNADAPAFATLFSAPGGLSPETIATTGIKVPGAAAGDGMEQPVWNPNTGSFFVSVPSFAGEAAGGVVEIKTDGTIGTIFRFASMGIASCSSTGLALGASGNLMVGCGNRNTQTIVLNPTGSGSIVRRFAQLSGSDEIWYDPTSHNFFATGARCCRPSRLRRHQRHDGPATAIGPTAGFVAVQSSFDRRRPVDRGRLRAARR